MHSFSLSAAREASRALLADPSEAAITRSPPDSWTNTNLVVFNAELLHRVGGEEPTETSIRLRCN